MVAPILYHTSVDGYAATFIFNILELTDTFALYRIFMAFVAAYLLYRNYLYSVNKENNVTNAAHSGLVRNDLKLLNNSIVTTSRRFSQVTKVFITLFTTKK
jgi:hypothetical protein